MPGTATASHGAFQCFGCLEHAHHRQMAPGEAKPVADWLFSTENDANGKPKGIGLSLWRFNVGAGSTEQGEDSQIGSPRMRTECFLQPDGSYNWDKQQGQRNFLRLAKERGVNKFWHFLTLLLSTSPKTDLLPIPDATVHLT